MRYAEIKNANGSYVIDDQYQNYRLCTIPMVKIQRCLTGLHVEKNEAGERVCTFPYYDYANGKTYAWPQGGKYPNPWCPSGAPNKLRSTISPASVRTFFDRPADLWTTVAFNGYAGKGIQSMLVFESLRWQTRFAISPNETVPYIFALGAAMPNVVYTFTTLYDPTRQRTMRNTINCWQRKSSLSQSLQNGKSFHGNNVGYTEFDHVGYYPDDVSGASQYKPREGENFTAESYLEEMETAPILYAFGLEDSHIALDKGEMVIKNERGEVVFNNRYDYMRILDYFPSVNALSYDGGGLYNSPKRYSYPGRKIAVVALSQNACYAAGADRSEWLYNTGFWFPDPSTVEFTTCITPFVRAGITDIYPDLSQDFASLASLLGVMILDVTGCTPGWKQEAQTGKPFLVEVE
nr:MAG TPA: hypothetical protein [Caudoviricetes sp.]